jgi:hypothetical protein
MKIVFILISLILLVLLYVYIRYTINLKNKLEELKRVKKTRKTKEKIAIVTMETRDSEMLSIHNKNLNDYCKLHNYTYIFKNSYENDLKLPIYWKKIQLVKEVLENGNFDYVMWLDSDTLIIDKLIPLEFILNDQSSIYMGKDKNSKLNLNAGVFIIKNDDIGINFLKECIDVYINRDICKDKYGNYSLNGKWSGECYEQGIMNELIKTKYFNKFRLFNDYIVLNTETPNTTCFILHLFGGTEKHKEYKRNIAFRYIVENNNYFDNRSTQLLFLIKYWSDVILGRV